MHAGHAGKNGNKKKQKTYKSLMAAEQLRSLCFQTKGAHCEWFPYLSGLQYETNEWCGSYSPQVNYDEKKKAFIYCTEESFRLTIRT